MGPRVRLCADVGMWVTELAPGDREGGGGEEEWACSLAGTELTASN